MKNQKFQNTNLQYDLEFDYDRTGCTCHDSICRCTSIINKRIEHIDPNRIIKQLMPAGSDIDKYCFERICYAYKIYDADYYTIESGYGYYGDEIYGVYFDKEEQIMRQYADICKLSSDLEKIQYCLEMEYGYLLDVVKNAEKAYIEDIATERIYVPQFEYFKKIDKDIIDTYRNRKYPVAVCIKNCSTYRLIDGYHRFAANKDNKLIQIIVLE